jgi:hypothetical protein
MIWKDRLRKSSKRAGADPRTAARVRRRNELRKLLQAEGVRAKLRRSACA